jgi:predicted nucleic acid-binding protein
LKVSKFDFDAARRWARFDPKRTLARRPDSELPFVSESAIAGPALLLDTCVYIDQLQDRSPAVLDRLIAVRQTNHSTVAIQELMHAVGVLDPDDSRTAEAIAAVRGLVLEMQAHRILVPDSEVLGQAALLSGILCRLQHYAADRRLRALQDCVLFLQAQKVGLTVLTANLADFDILLQLLPTGRVLFYRTKER